MKHMHVIFDSANLQGSLYMISRTDPVKLRLDVYQKNSVPYKILAPMETEF